MGKPFVGLPLRWPNTSTATTLFVPPIMHNSIDRKNNKDSRPDDIVLNPTSSASHRRNHRWRPIPGFIHRPSTVGGKRHPLLFCHKSHDPPPAHNHWADVIQLPLLTTLRAVQLQEIDQSGYQLPPRLRRPTTDRLSSFTADRQLFFQSGKTQPYDRWDAANVYNERKARRPQPRRL